MIKNVLDKTCQATCILVYMDKFFDYLERFRLQVKLIFTLIKFECEGCAILISGDTHKKLYPKTFDDVNDTSCTIERRIFTISTIQYFKSRLKRKGL